MIDPSLRKRMVGLVEMCESMNRELDELHGTDSRLRIIPRMYGGKVRAIEVRTVDFVPLKSDIGDP